MQLTHVRKFWEQFEGGDNFEVLYHALVPTIYGSTHTQVVAEKVDDLLAVGYINRCGLCFGPLQNEKNNLCREATRVMLGIVDRNLVFCIGHSILCTACSGTDMVVAGADEYAKLDEILMETWNDMGREWSDATKLISHVFWKANSRALVHKLAISKINRRCNFCHKKIAYHICKGCCAVRHCNAACRRLDVAHANGCDRLRGNIWLYN